MKMNALAILFSTMAFTAPLCAEPSLVLIGNPDAAMTNDLVDNLSDTVSIKTEKDDFDLSQGSNIVMQFMEQPDVSSVQATLDRLGQSGKDSMHIIMVDEANGFDWLAPLAVPENVWTTITIKSRDTMEVESTYRQAGVTYDGAGVQYKMKGIARAAFNALASGGANDRFGEISRLGVMDTGFLTSGASTEAQSSLVQAMNTDWSDLELESLYENGLTDTRFLVDGLQTDIEATAAFLIETECIPNPEWFPRVDPKLYFQTFGLQN